MKKQTRKANAAPLGMMTRVEALRKHFADEVSRWKDRPQITMAEACPDMNDVIVEFRDYCSSFIDHFATTEIPAWLEQKILDTLSEYWAPITRTLTQYYIPYYCDKLNKVTKGVLKKFLVQAEHVAKFTPPDVLLYIDKTPLAYVYPYTLKSFIGLPLMGEISQSGLYYSEDILSLPHELGHQVFWNTKFPPHKQKTSSLFEAVFLENNLAFPDSLFTSIESKNDDDPNQLLSLMNNWAEEIFADVLGTLILGEEAGDYVRSSQSLTVRKSKDQEALLQNDEKHPVPYLRPMIAAYTMEINNIPGYQEWSHGEWKSYQDLTFQIPDEKELVIKRHVVHDQKLEEYPLSVSQVSEALRKSIQDINDLIAQGLPRAEPIQTFDEHLASLKKKCIGDKFLADEDVDQALLMPFVKERARSGWCTHCGQSDVVCRICGSSWVV